jgi:hypothetical protein
MRALPESTHFQSNPPRYRNRGQPLTINKGYSVSNRAGNVAWRVIPSVVDVTDVLTAVTGIQKKMRVVRP